jgi:choline dehydrogenase
MMAGMVASARPLDQSANEFDYVVIGAGSSGCVIVNRLTADPAVRVLLLEAGGPDVDPAILAPGRWTTLLGTAVDWNYQVEPEPGLAGRAIRWPRGKTYGGSSAISAMAYVRGHQLDFDRWAATCGPSWSFREVLPYFRRIEDNSRGASDYHGTGGPQAVTDQSDPHAGHAAFLGAASELGFAARPDWDFNGATQENGAGFYQKNIRAGRRHSAAAAFLTPVLSRPNLTVWPNTRALRILFEGTRTTGVACARAGGTAAAPASTSTNVRARRGVIVSTGAIESPKILMLSGIGPADALRALGIVVRVDAPGVGANLHDHPRVPVRWAARTPLAPSSVSAGLLTWSQRGSAPSPPDLQFYVGRGLDTPDPSVTLTVALSRPESRGTISLRSADPSAPPLIRANYLAEPGDVDALVEAVRLARSLAETRAYAAIRGAATDPGDAVRSAENIRAYIRRVADTMFHPAGTCRMGSDAGAVVDPELRVRGVDGLWVADASIMPVCVNCQTHAACAMIGERAAELVGGGARGVTSCFLTSRNLKLSSRPM